MQFFMDTMSDDAFLVLFKILVQFILTGII